MGLGRHIHGLFGWPIFFAVSLTHLLFTVVAQVLVMPLDRKRKLCLWLNHLTWGRVLYWAVPFWRLRRNGVKKVGAGPYVIVCNHGSVLDIPANMSLPVPMRVVGRYQLFRIPILGWYMSFSRQLPIDLSGTEKLDAFFASCRQTLAAGISVLMFPEGSRSPNGALGPFQSGAFRLAHETGTRVLPTTVEGTRHILGKGLLWPKALVVPVQLSVLDTVDPAGFDSPRALAKAVRAQMAVSLGQEQQQRHTCEHGQ